MGSKAQAQVIVYVAETAVTGHAASILEYDFNASTDAATLENTIALPGIVGLSTSSTTTAEPNEGALELSENGSTLSYAGFNSSHNSVEVQVNLSNDSVNSSTVDTGDVIRASFTADGNTVYAATGSLTVATLPAGVTSTGATTVTSGGEAGVSANNIIYNASLGNIYFSRNSTGAGGVYMATPSGSGLLTTAQSFTILSGTGWSKSDVYNGMAFLGNNTLFVANTTANALDVFVNTTPSSASGWNTQFTLSLTSNEDIQQVSVDQLDTNDALVFFTTNSGTGGGTSTFDEVSYNSTTGFGTVNTLENSTTEFYSGIVAIPEPGTYALFGLGLGLIGLMSLRRKAGKEICPK